MTPLVSILVPIYNVSSFIEKCAHSLFSQTLNCVEFIFVNDATTDDSVEKLLKVMTLYPQRKNAIKIIHHQNNYGLAVARKSALLAASGEYTLTIDSDDYIETNMVEILYNAAKIEDADIAVCDLFIQSHNTISIIKDSVPSDENYLDFILSNQSCCGSLCNKLIRRSLYLNEECSVPDGLNYLEDLYVTSRLYYFAHKIIKIDKPLYHYNKYNPLSICNTKGTMHFENIYRFWTLMEEFLYKKNLWEHYRKNINKAKAAAKVQLLVETHSYKARKEFRSLFEEEERQYFATFRFGEKIMSLCVRYRLFLIAQLWHDLLWIKNRLPALILNKILPAKNCNF